MTMSTQPIDPDELNEILASPSVDLGVDEATEQEVLADFFQLADRMGEEKFAELGMTFLLSVEPRLRETMSPDALPIRMLDEYHLLHG
jgi:hypothetical protein